MVPSVKPAIKSETKGETSYVSSHLVFHHLLYMLIEKSHNSALLAPIKFLKKPSCSLRVSESDGV